MTWTYRQLQGIMPRYAPIVLTGRVENQMLFPFEPVVERRLPAWQAQAFRVQKKLLGKVGTVTQAQQSVWREAARRHHAQLIHGHFGYSAFGLLPVAKVLNIPLLITFHGVDASTYLRRRRYRRDLQAVADHLHIIAVSKHVKRNLVAAGVPAERITVHYIGLPLEDFHSIPRTSLREKTAHNETVRFLQVSRFEEKKGHRFTVQAFAQLTKEYPQSELVLVGAGKLLKPIQALVDHLKLTDKVVFTGHLPPNKVRAQMHAADVYVQHSVTARNGDQEGLPVSPMEAMATGLPVVSTYHSGIPELVSDGANGYLSPERDVEHFSARLLDSLNDDGTLSRCAEETVRSRFNMKQQNNLLANLYQKCIDEHQSSL